MTTKLQSIALGLILSAVSTAFATIPDSLKLRIDSLMKVSAGSTGLQKYEADFKIAWDLFDVDNHLAAVHAGRAYAAAQVISDTAKVVRSGRLFGQLLRRTDHLDSAIYIFDHLLPVARKLPDQEETGRILSALALIYTFQCKFDQALTYNLRSLRLAEQVGDNRRMASSLGNIGFNYYHMGNHEEAVRYFEKAVPLGDSVSKSIHLLNMALAKIYLHEFSLFAPLAHKALLLTPARYKNQRLGIYEFGCGLISLKKGRIDSAKTHFSSSLMYAEMQSDRRLSADCLIRLAECAEKQGDLNSSIRILKELEAQSHDLRYRSTQVQCYNRLSSVYEEKHDWREALRYSKMASALSDSLYNEGMHNNMALSRVEREEQENQIIVAKQAEIINLNIKVIDRQNWLVGVSICLTLLAALFAFVLYRFNRFQKRISIELDRKVFERTVELQRSERNLVRSLSDQKALMDVVVRKVQASVATFRGLWQIDGIEADNEMKDRFESTANELLQVSGIIHKSVSI